MLDFRLQTKVKRKISILKEKHARLTSAELAHAELTADSRLVQLELTRDLSQVILHVDMDAFYAACEERDDPRLASVPVAGTNYLRRSDVLELKVSVRYTLDISFHCSVETNSIDRCVKSNSFWPT